MNDLEVLNDAQKMKKNPKRIKLNFFLHNRVWLVGCKYSL